MKRIALVVSLLALSAVAAFGQTTAGDAPIAAPSRLSFSDAIDLKLHATPVAVYRLKTFSESDLFGRKGLNVSFDLDTFVSFPSSLSLGLGVTHTWNFTVAVSKEFRPQVGLTAGLWSNYGTGAGKLTGGPYIGASVRF